MLDGVELPRTGQPLELGCAAIGEGDSRSGHEVFDRKVYYFESIPTDVQPLSVVLVVVGAVAIAVLFSILPALRAALLHPVRALRYE